MTLRTLFKCGHHVFASAIVAGVILGTALAQQEEAFPFNFTDGSGPQGGLVADAAGNLYGTTTYGGSGICWNNLGNLIGCGTVFELSPPRPPSAKWTFAVLYNFAPIGIEGLYPIGDLVFDRVGNLYGVTLEGGQSNVGTVFELSPPSQPGGTWSEATLCGFGFDCDGGPPTSGLIVDGSGNLYGTAQGGGSCGAVSCGIVFELSQTQGGWSQNVLYNFQGQRDGASPMAPVVLDSKGNLYGTTAGRTTYNQGTVFELSPPSQPGGLWTESVLHSFGNGPGDGTQPMAGLAVLPSGSLLGTTALGGAKGVGTAFGLRPPGSSGGAWQYGVLYSFGANPGDGALPLSGLTPKNTQQFFGTTSSGGAEEQGTVFQLAAPSASGGQWTETPIYSFTGAKDGGGPAAGVILSSGVLFGTTVSGGYKNNGVAFRLSH